MIEAVLPPFEYAFLVELYCKKTKNHFASIIVRANGHIQFYLGSELHIHYHQSLEETDIEGYVAVYQRRQFTLLDDNEIEHAPRPNKFLMILGNNRNYVLPEFVVINKFDADPYKLASQIPFEQFAQLMFVDHFDDLKNKLSVSSWVS